MPFPRRFSSALVAVLMVLAFFAVTVIRPPTTQAQSYQTISKSCGRCGRSVPLSSQVGQRCPHCGAVWGSQSSHYTTSSVYTNPRQSSYSGPIPITLSITLADYSSSFIADNLAPFFLNRPHPMIGGELGIGLGSQGTWFGVLRYRQFQHESIITDLDWHEKFFEGGFRSYIGKPIGHLIQPFLGCGLGYASVDFGNGGSSGIYGVGLYLDGGLEFRLSNTFSLAGLGEYSAYRLMISDHSYDGPDPVLGTDEQLYLKTALTFSFHRQR